MCSFAQVAKPQLVHYLSGVTQDVSFYVWCLPASTMFSVFTHVVACVSTSLPFLNIFHFMNILGLPGWLSDKRICLQCRRRGFLSLGWEEPLEEEMATHSRILAWRIPWTEEPGGL